MEDGKFNQWYKEAEASMGEMHKGRKLLSEKGCLGCHTVDGTPKVGPTLKGVYGHEVTVTENGKEKTITADEAYLQKSILQPEFDVVKGYQPIMPAIPLTKEELQAIIDYIKGIQ
jgi:cytochrome c oxidase subunit 2